MANFDDRERGFEAKYAHDAEMQFKAEARRNRLLGEWAAGQLGKTGTEAEAYVREVIKADFQEAGPEDVVRKVAADLEGKASEQEVRAKLAECQSQAKAQLADEG